MQLEPGALVVSQLYTNILYYVILDIIEDDVFLYDVREARLLWGSVAHVKNSFLFL
jgi:hypothetical protein